jgi:hypothetical protein
MEQVFIISICITVLFCVAKVVEMKFIDKKFKPMKYLMRDAIIVLASSAIVTYAVLNMNSTIKSFFNVVTDSKTITPATTEVFTDAPGF